MDGRNYIELIRGENVSILSTEIADGFVGCTLGIYATSEQINFSNYADFAWLELEKIIP